MATLDVSVEGIIDGVVAAIAAAVAAATPGSTFASVQAVVRGDRARPLPALPSVWVVPQLAQNDPVTFGEEHWTLPLSIAGLVQSDDPATGGRNSQRITALARSAVLDIAAPWAPAGAAVTDVASVSFDPTARSSERNRTLFWTEAVVAVTFTVAE